MVFVGIRICSVDVFFWDYSLDSGVLQLIPRIQVNFKCWKWLLKIHKFHKLFMETKNSLVSKISSVLKWKKETYE